ncbi:small G protein signaling modulator 1-like [Dorcoceras hygrometricum]|uniref:Small G protein signaling modulator 1-like n=1 Tax=Dorcoceras hygrometricum TaxID=472368 RepID=A0A2Z7CE48_9LAMI|nr:small G protein signaling modulator 1-like [Dorcoceras hygrometricum]
MDAGIDQLNFHSVQLGYLNFLQMGNADPTRLKQKQIRGQASVRRAINSYACNILTINAMKCMWLSKEINRQFKSSRLHTTVCQPGNHRSVIYRDPSVLTAQCYQTRPTPTKRRRIGTRSSYVTRRLAYVIRSIAQFSNERYSLLTTDLLTSSTRPDDVTLKRCQISRYNSNAITIQRCLRHTQELLTL